MNLNVISALYFLRNAEVWSAAHAGLECRGTRRDCCAEGLWLCSQCFALPNSSVDGTCVCFKTICCLCLVKKVCSDAGPCKQVWWLHPSVRRIVVRYLWRMNVWSGGVWCVDLCSLQLHFYNSVSWLFKMWSAMHANSQGIARTWMEPEYSQRGWSGRGVQDTVRLKKLV